MDTISIWMSTEDADVVQKIYDRTDLPNFTIVKRCDMAPTHDITMLEISAESTMSIWHLAKLVQIEWQFKMDMEETHKKVRQIVEDTRKKIFENGLE